MNQREAHAALVEPYLRQDPGVSRDWALIDNADADDLREALKAVILSIAPRSSAGHTIPLDITNHHNAAVCPYCIA